MTNNLSTTTTNDRAQVTRGSILTRPFADAWGFDPFRNFFSSLSQYSGMEVTRSDSGYQVEIPVAGYRPEEVDITLENGVLTVSGKSEKRSFTRSLILPEEIDADNIEAKVENGMLTLQLNLLPKAQPKKISIKQH